MGLAIALAYLPMAHRPQGWFKTIVKSLPLFLFAMAAILAQAHPFLSAALLLSAAGDFALSRPGKKAFLYGLSSFALAHILFAMLFLSLSDQQLWNAFTLNTPFALIMLALALSTEIWLTPYSGSLQWPVRAYVTLIAAMALAALTLPDDMIIVAFGAALFVASDLLLAIQKFRLPSGASSPRPLHWAIWVLYIAAQAMILWGLNTL